MKNSHLWEQPSTEGGSWWINAPAPYPEVEVFLRCMLYTVAQSSPQIRFYSPVVPTCLITPLISTFPAGAFCNHLPNQVLPFISLSLNPFLGGTWTKCKNISCCSCTQGSSSVNKDVGRKWLQSLPHLPCIRQNGTWLCFTWCQAKSACALCTYRMVLSLVVCVHVCNQEESGREIEGIWFSIQVPSTSSLRRLLNVWNPELGRKNSVFSFY